jgi:predicted MFS family arabinose efflux permease
VRVIGFILLATLLLPVLFLKPRMIPGASRKLIDKTVFSDWPFIVFLFGNFVYLLGAFTPFFYVEVYSIQSKIASADLSFYIISIMNAASAIGRVLPNFISAYTGPFNMLILSTILTFIFGFGLVGTHNVASLIVVSAFYGGVTGLFFALQPVVLIGLCPDPKLVGTRVGIALAFLSFAVLVSNPIAGAIQTRGGFVGVWLWTGVTTAVGTGIMCVSRLMRTKGGFFVKV